MPTNEFPWIQLVSSLGFPAVVVIMIIRGWLVPGFVYQRIVEDNDRLSRVVEQQVIPLVTESKQVLREALDVAPMVKDFQHTLKENLARVEEARKSHQRTMADTRSDYEDVLAGSQRLLRDALIRLEDNERASRRKKSD